MINGSTNIGVDHQIDTLHTYDIAILRNRKFLNNYNFLMIYRLYIYSH